MEELNAVLPEGLPLGMVKEFEESKRTSLLVRRSFLDLRDNFRRVVDPPLQSFDAKGRVFPIHCLCFLCLSSLSFMCLIIGVPKLQCSE